MSRREKIVVTGGAGFIGSHLVDRLLLDGCPVVVLDNMHRGRLENLARHRSEPRLSFVHGDIRDARLVASILQDATVVYHLAAQSTVMGAVQDLDYSFETNVLGTFNVLRAASQLGVDKVIFASSREVYGDPIDLPVAEDQPLLAVNAYGASKVAGEAYCRAFRRAFGLQTIILRLANVYGPRDIGRVIPLWLARAAAGKDLDVYGGKQVIDFVWIEYILDALIRARTISGPVPAINVGSGTGTRLIDLARRVIRLQGGRSRLNVLPARSIEVTRFIANVDRMQQLLSIEPPRDPLLHLEDLATNAMEEVRYAHMPAVAAV